MLTDVQIARDENNLSKGYGFVSFTAFEASDDAIANMNGQYLMNKEVSVQYAYKKDGKGERHGDQAERMLAAQARKHNIQPQVQPPMPPQAMAAPTPSMPPTPAVDGDLTARGIAPVPPADFGAGRGVPPMMNGGAYPGVPPQQPAHHRPPPPPQGFGQPSLATPPPGLPARPPPSQVGFGGPPQGFAPPPGFGRQPPPPTGFGPPPVGAPMGAPPPGQLPPGFQHQGYGRGR